MAWYIKTGLKQEDSRGFYSEFCTAAGFMRNMRPAASNVIGSANLILKFESALFSCLVSTIDYKLLSNTVTRDLNSAINSCFKLQLINKFNISPVIIN